MQSITMKKLMSAFNITCIRHIDKLSKHMSDLMRYNTKRPKVLQYAPEDGDVELSRVIKFGSF